jgi:MFS family permease
LLALFGAVMGQGVIWYTGQFYAQSFLENTCKLEFEQSRTIMLWGIAFATPFFLLFGWLSDKIGRKWIMLIGMLLGILTYRPIFNTFLEDTNDDVWKTDSSISNNQPVIKKETVNTGNTLLLTSVTYSLANDTRFTEIKTEPLSPEATKENTKIIYKDKHLSSSTYWKFVGLVFLLILYVTMVYGPIAAFLVEMFPTKIRYTSMSLPYHIGNGVFGGLVPFIGLLLTTTYPADPLVGLWYPIGIAALCFIIGIIYLRNKIDEDVSD